MFAPNELRAMRVLEQVVRGLDVAEQRRVIVWSNDRLAANHDAGT
jgi:hypothetical protein